jgi:GT2 family glycosyltransferase
VSRPPRVAVIVPARGAYSTIERCLESLEAQTFRDFETIVVDDSAGNGMADLLVSLFPGVRHRHAPGASASSLRDIGVGSSAAPLLVFTEPDAYARPDWLERMVRAHDDTGEAVAGAIDCFGERWLDRAVHLCNFAKWLPGGARREVDVVPGASILVRRRDLAAAGGFPGERFIGDVAFSIALRARGRGIVLEPAAVVEHHWGKALGEFARERWRGGRRYGTLQARHRGSDRVELLMRLGITALPVRFTAFSLRLAMRCASAGRLSALAAGVPVVSLGFALSLAGEACSYGEQLFARHS